MHGRLKVRTSEEEKERKKKEQTLKVKAYKAGMNKIHSKRQLEQYDDEMVLLTTQMLLRNPDHLTLWGVRKQCVLAKVQIVANEELQVEPENLEEQRKQKLQAIYESELVFSEQCLRSNPKSYGAWHHRCWALENCPMANWEKEVKLCDMYLKMDERNFHTWDYRRYVVEKAAMPAQKELDFCTEKIKTNFSNYSSWHHRSLLLPKLYPHELEAGKPQRPMSEQKLKEELEIVITAAFTDPNDSSAWFYQRWLLGHSRSELKVCAFRCNHQKAVLCFSHAFNGKDLKAYLTNQVGENVLQLVHWQALNQTSVDNTFWLTMPANIELKLNATYVLNIHIPAWPQAKEICLSSTLCQHETEQLYYIEPPKGSVTFSSLVLNELQSQLDSCQSLLEFEPDSKWTLLTSALLMKAIDARQYHEKSLEYLQKLQKVDHLRQEYYKDLASKWIMEKLLQEWSWSPQAPFEIDLSNTQQLSSLCYAQYLSIADDVQLSEDLQNHLKKRNLKLCTFKDIHL